MTKSAAGGGYILDEQVGFLLRQVSQRHTTLFAARMGADITPTQWAVLSKLAEVGATSQNLLGRMTAMDVATIKGVVDRLTARRLIGTTQDPTDARRRLVALSEDGERFVAERIALAFEISEETLAPLGEEERKAFRALLEKMR